MRKLILLVTGMLVATTAYAAKTSTSYQIPTGFELGVGIEYQPSPASWTEPRQFITVPVKFHVWNPINFTGRAEIPFGGDKDIDAGDTRLRVGLELVLYSAK